MICEEDWIETARYNMANLLLANCQFQHSVRQKRLRQRQRDREFKYFKKYPTLIAEILSESTEAKDRGKKFEHYRYLETLQEYVLVSQTQQQAEVFRKNKSGLWVLHPFGEGDEVNLISLDMRFSIACLYEDVEFETTFKD